MSLTKLKEKKIKGVKKLKAFGVYAYGNDLIYEEATSKVLLYKNKKSAKERMNLEGIDKFYKIIPVLITPIKGRKISQIKKK